MKFRNLLVILLITVFALFSADALAQCSMCQAVVESNMQGQQKSFGMNLNNAILYLMAVPYILLGVVGFLFYRKLKATAE